MAIWGVIISRLTGPKMMIFNKCLVIGEVYIIANFFNLFSKIWRKNISLRSIRPYKLERLGWFRQLLLRSWAILGLHGRSPRILGRYSGDIRTFTHTPWTSWAFSEYSPPSGRLLWFILLLIVISGDSPPSCAFSALPALPPARSGLLQYNVGLTL